MIGESIETGDMPDKRVKTDEDKSRAETQRY